MGWMLTRGVLKTCEHCMMAKAKQKNVRKESVAKKVTIPRHCLYVDISKVTDKLGTSKNVTIN